MQMWMQRIVCLVFVLGSWAQLSRAEEKPSVVTGALHRIEQNALAVKHDASIYQWERVDDEVDRIAAAEHKIHKAFANDAAKRDLADILGRDVHELRSADFARDVKRSVKASEKLTALIPKLQDAVGGPATGH